MIAYNFILLSKNKIQLPPWSLFWVKDITYELTAAVHADDDEEQQKKAAAASQCAQYDWITKGGKTASPCCTCKNK